MLRYRYFGKVLFVFLLLFTESCNTVFTSRLIEISDLQTSNTANNEGVVTSGVSVSKQRSFNMKSSPLHRSPVNLDSRLKVKTHSSSDLSGDMKKKSPNLRAALSPKQTAHSQSFEAMLHAQLVNHTEILLRFNAEKTSHDSHLVGSHSRQRAADSVDERLAAILGRLAPTTGSAQTISAYAHLSALLTAEVEAAVFSAGHDKLSAAHSAQHSLREESSRVHEVLTESIARKDQRISGLETSVALLEAKCAALARANEGLQRELRSTAASLSETHQQTVELRMQGWDFKSEVDRRSQKVLAGVAARMGLVPSGIQRQVSLLQMLKPPGDPEYDRSREQQASSSRSLSARRAARVSPGPASREHLLSGSTDTDGPTSPVPGAARAVDRDGTPRRPTAAALDRSDFRRFLLRTAAADAAEGSSPKIEQMQRHSPSQDFHQTYLARLDYLPVGSSAAHANDAAAAVMGGGDHRRMSSASNASGCTDRRSSTSSNGLTATTVGSSSPTPSRHSASVAPHTGYPFAAADVTAVRAPWSFKPRDAESAASSSGEEDEGEQPRYDEGDGEDLGGDSDAEAEHSQARALLESGFVEALARVAPGRAPSLSLLQPPSPEKNLLRLRDDAAGAQALRMAGSVSPQQQSKKGSPVASRGATTN